MAKGLPKSIIKKYGISKKAWSVYRGRKKSKSRTTKSKTKRRKKRNNPVRRVRRTARRRRRKRGGGKNWQGTIFKWLRVAALVGPAAYQAAKWPSMEDKLRQILIRYTGYDVSTGQFSMGYLAEGYGPFLATCLATYGIPKISGIIRKL